MQGLAWQCSVLMWNPARIRAQRPLWEAQPTSSKTASVCHSSPKPQVHFLSLPAVSSLSLFSRPLFALVRNPPTASLPFRYLFLSAFSHLSVSYLSATSLGNHSSHSASVVGVVAIVAASLCRAPPSLSSLCLLIHTQPPPPLPPYSAVIFSVRVPPHSETHTHTHHLILHPHSLSLTFSSATVAPQAHRQPPTAVKTEATDCNTGATIGTRANSQPPRGTTEHCEGQARVHLTRP